MAENDHKHHVPSPSDIEGIQKIREATIAMDALFAEICPAGRDLALAQTNLEQARMWAIAALVKPRPVAEED